MHKCVKFYYYLLHSEFLIYCVPNANRWLPKFYTDTQSRTLPPEFKKS